MDEAWKLEQESWAAIGAGRPDAFYAQHLTADGFVVLPGRVMDRHELVLPSDAYQALRRYELGVPRMTMVDGESLLISYRVEADADWLDDYHGQVSSLYTWSGGGWALAFRQHTPDREVTACWGHRE